MLVTSIRNRGIIKSVRQMSTMSSAMTSRLTNSEIRAKRTKIFSQEQQRQKDLIPRIEKIQVEYKGVPEDATLVLNKLMSTPYNVAQHLSEMLIDRSALALVNGQLWDLHRPLEEDCTIELCHFYMDDPRSCSFLLGAALESIFKDDLYIELHSFPAPNVPSGSFVHDVDLKIPNWTSTKEELMVLSAAMHKIGEKNLPFERLVVDASLAQEMFSENRFKVKHIPNIAEKSKTGNTVTLYRVGDHVDISGGPMIGNSGFLGRRCSIMAAHQIEHDGETLYRFQGVALPKGIFLNHFAYGVLEKRASKLNTANLPSAQKVTPS